MQFNVDIASLAPVHFPPAFLQADDFPVRERSRRRAWAVVLAGGDGVRLRPLSRLIAGDDRPKQFCRLFGDRTLLAHTRARLAPVVEDEHTLFVVTKSHETYFREELNGVHSSRVIVQPKNKGTGAAIAAAVLRIAERDPNAVIAFIPSDHFYRNARHFQSSVAAAIETAAEWQESIVLLGAQSTHAETDYGWIEPGGTAAGDFSGNLHRVRCFWEKPSAQIAEALHSRACLWSTFVMTGHVNAFLRMLENCVPGLLDTLMAAQRKGHLEDAYLSEALASVDFSSQVLARSTEQLFVVRMPASAGWSDLGAPERVMTALADAGMELRHRALGEGVVAAMA